MIATSGPRPDRQVVAFILLVFGLSLPFVLGGSLISRFLPDSLPIRLPFSALAAFVPMVAALILVGRRDGLSGVRALLLRAADPRPVKGVGWWIAALTLLPAAMLLEYGLLVLRQGPVADAVLPLGSLPVFLVMFLAAAIGEELGWQGFLYDRLEQGRPALTASLMVAAIWALWHVIPFLQTGHGVGWAVWQLACLFPLRVITSWLYVASGRSLLIAVLFHVMTNVAEFMFPNFGSHYDPFVTFVILSIVAVGVVIRWGPRTMAGRG